MPSLAAILSFLGATLSPRRARLLLPVLALGLPSLRAATFGDFEYTDTGTAITITKYTGNEQVVTIPGTIDNKPVTSIGDDAFYECTSLAGVALPESVTIIGGHAFSKCSGITSVTIPAGVTTIGGGAFSQCFALTNVTIPDSVITIGGGAFSECGLTKVTIPNRVTVISQSAFSGCSDLTDVTIPNSVISISDFAFSGCRSLTAVAIPNSVTAIGDWAFDQCSSLSSITIPASVTSIGYSTFAGCVGLTNVTIPAGVTSIGGGAFQRCSKLTRAIFLGNAPATFGEYAFLLPSPSFTIYYPSTATGFTTPLWKGYPTQMGFPTFAQWIAGFGLGASAQLPDSNPSGDGLPNLVKYALWLDPTLPATSGQPVLVSEDGPLVYRVTLSLLTTGISSTIQTSADLVNWDDALTTIESSTATTVTASVTLPTGTPRRFARLVVTQP